tara:strand:- start:879 stop:1286 length:408 start_codon:yes stop_codon:yes gene_type:complete
MSDYDNTNKGAAFAPFPDQKFVLSGKLNIEGIEKQCVYIAGTTQGGKRVMRVYQEIGIMFENESDNERAPNYSGTIQDHLKEEMKIAAWKRQQENTGNNYLSITVSEKQNSSGYQASNNEEEFSTGKQIEDEIPF